MIFLQPLALAAIPLILIPLIIHWLNHRRHKPLHWAAMHFLKQAQKHNRGMAKLRYWLLLALRMFAIAAIVFLLSRPLQTGYLASWTGAPATNLIVLDLSPSMQSTQNSGGGSAIEHAVHQLDHVWRSTGQMGKRIVFTQPTHDPMVLPGDIALSQALTSSKQAATTDIPATLNAALHWASNHVAGPIDMWICSDLRESDWQSESSRWTEIVEKCKALPAVRVNILTSGKADSSTSGNAALTVDRVVRRQVGNRAELVFDLHIQQTSGEATSRAITLSFEIAGVRSTVDVELNGRERILAGHVVPIDSQLESGFGTVSLPADSNPADNQYQFVFASPVPVHVAVVAEDVAVGKVLQLALERPTSENTEVKVNLFSPAQVSQIDWAKTAMVAWQADLPSAELAAKMAQVIDRGGSMIFLPPSSDTNGSHSLTAGIENNGMTTNRVSGSNPLKVRWRQWQQTLEGSQPWQLGDWRSDSDLLRNTEAGLPIPVHEWKFQQLRGLEALDAIPLAMTVDGQYLLARIATDRGGLYFLATLPAEAYSNLVEEGVSLYVMMQRALESSLSSTGNARGLTAGQDVPSDLATWTKLDESQQTILDDQRSLCSGVYQKDSKLIAINRSKTEDNPETIRDDVLRQLMGDIDFQLVVDSGSKTRPLASEIWRWFAAILVVCLLMEAWMTMPRATGIQGIRESEPARQKPESKWSPSRLQEGHA